MTTNPKDAKPHGCPWVDLTRPDYLAYHGREWGVPVHDDRRLFEFLTSWYTVLRKRESYREAFEGFDPEKVARYEAAKIDSLLQNPGIIRNCQKILAAVNNTKRFLQVREAFGSFDGYVWRFVDGRPIVNVLNAWMEPSP